MPNANSASLWTQSRLATRGTHGVYRLRGKAMTRLETLLMLLLPLL